MVKDILSAIDNEIACLQHAKALLSPLGTVVALRKPGSEVISADVPKKTATKAA